MKKILFLAVLIIICLSFPVNASLVSHWSFDGALNDVQGDNDGTFFGGTPGFVQGRVGQALSLDGVDDYVEVPHDNSLNTNNALTVSAWVKMVDNNAIYPVIVKAKDLESGFHFVITYGVLFFRVANSGSYSDIRASYPNNNDWHHIAAVFDGTTEKLYVDGVEVRSESAEISSIASGTSVLRIGRSTTGYSGGASRFDGVVDEIKLFNHALNSQEILDEYNQGTSGEASADLDGDGDVDIDDLIIVANNFGLTSGFDERADTDDNEVIDIFDVVYVASNFGTIEPPPPPPPAQCTGNCLASQCNSYDNCASASGECSSGNCCTGSCTTPPAQCTGSCMSSSCSSYDNCNSASGECSSGNCCTGSCTTPPPPPPPDGDVVYAAGCSRDQIQSAVNSASAGDTVMIPACTNNNFVGTVTFSANIKIRGAGKDSTVLARSSASSAYLFTAEFTANNQLMEFSDITLKGLKDESTLDRGLRIRYTSDRDNAQIKIWNCRFEGFGYSGIFIENYVKGVIFESDFVDNFRSGYGYGVYVMGTKPSDSVMGDWAYDTFPLNYGSEEFVFIEDCALTGTTKHKVLSARGGRYVVRYNTISGTVPGTGAAALDVHGIYPGSSRAGRAIEIYENIINLGLPPYYAAQISGADGVIYNNQISSNGDGDPYIFFRHSCCEGNTCGPYPEEDQIHDMYIWGNSFGGNSENDNRVRAASSCPSYLYSRGRDYYFTPRPGYTPYTYPHPLRNN